MLNFDYSNKTRIVFGKGTETQVGSLVKPYAEKVLLHYGGGSIKKSGLYDRVAASLRESGVSFVELGGVQPNPRLSLIHQGIELCRREGIGFILAVGGGSVIDSAKAIAMGVPYDGRRVGFLRNRQAYRDCPAGCHHFDSARHRQRSQRRNRCHQ